MAIRYQSVLEHGLEPSAALVTRGFSDYFVPISLSGASLLTMVRQDSVDLEASRVVIVDDVAVGVAFIARRGWTTRLAAMALVPEARTRGAGEACVRHVMDEARARGERTMVLEVIEQNGRAVRLYERCGFRTVDRLVGYEGVVAHVDGAQPPVACDVHEVARALIAHGPPDLPWQLSGETLGQAVPPAAGYRSEHSWLAISDPSAAKVGIRALVTLPGARRRGDALELLRAVIAQHAGKTWRVPAIWPERYGALFEKLGLQRTELTQWLMSAALTR